MPGHKLSTALQEKSMFHDSSYPINSHFPFQPSNRFTTRARISFFFHSKMPTFPIPASAYPTETCHCSIRVTSFVHLSALTLSSYISSPSHIFSPSPSLYISLSLSHNLPVVPASPWFKIAFFFTYKLFTVFYLNPCTQCLKSTLAYFLM